MVTKKQYKFRTSKENIEMLKRLAEARIGIPLSEEHKVKLKGKTPWNMVIECDGNYWHKYPTGTEIDHIRTKELLKSGFKVLRLWEFEIHKLDLTMFKNKLDL
jgi:hypothetical protein